MNLGLGYESSDEEDVVKPVKTDKPTVHIEAPIVVPNPSKPGPQPEHTQTSPGPINGPAQGPSLGPTTSPPPTIDASPEDGDPKSPYTSNRAAIQNFTLPTVPNFDIPPSPPGSPPQRTSKKFAQFLDLKKKGQHFNQRLEKSSVIRDPGHLQRLYDFAGIGEEDQYASTLPENIVIPATFPEWAYVEELNASQKKIRKTTEDANVRNPRQAIDFVAAGGPGASSGTGTPSGKTVGQGATGHSGKRKEPEP